MFLNRRYFVLDRLSRRLYVFTSDISPSPRYCIDFITVKCQVDGLAPLPDSLLPSALAPLSGTSLSSLTSLDEMGLFAPFSDSGLSSRARGGPSMSFASYDPTMSPGRASLNADSLDALPSTSRQYGIEIKGNGVLILAYAASQREYYVWLKALSDAAGGRVPVRSQL